jgi:CelD/BcsL family acetyltransferase involved in cellulose biosynthesis
MPLNEEGFIARVAIRHSVSADAVRTIMQALRAGGGTMAQFSHPEFGGMSQWSPGMSMVGDMFNNSLKSKLDAVCTELAAYVAHTPSTDQDRSHRRRG